MQIFVEILNELYKYKKYWIILYKYWPAFLTSWLGQQPIKIFVFLARIASSLNWTWAEKDQRVRIKKIKSYQKGIQHFLAEFNKLHLRLQAIYGKYSLWIWICLSTQMLSTQELTFNFIILWSAITDKTKYEDTQEFASWARNIENYDLAGHPTHPFRKISNNEAQNTNLDSPQIFFIAFLDETPSISPLDWVLEIFKQKWNIKRNQMRVSTKYQRDVTTSSEGWKGKLLVV